MYKGQKKESDITYQPAAEEGHIDKKAIKKFRSLFYIPAFNTPDMVKMGAVITAGNPPIKAVSEKYLFGGVISEEEARQVADLVYIFFEAAKSDFLKEIDFSLRLTRPRIVAMPFHPVGKKIYDLVLGQSWPREIFEDWGEIVTFTENIKSSAS